MQEQTGLVDKETIDKNLRLIQDADIILMQLEIPIETVEYVCSIFKNKKIILDPAPASTELSDKIFKSLYIIKPNETELNILTGMPTNTIEQVVEAGNYLLNKGIQNVIVSLGGNGSVLINHNGYRHFPPIKVKSVDTTAAGDSFIAAISLSLATEHTIPESIEFATKVASLTVQKKGAQASIPSIEEVNNIS